MTANSPQPLETRPPLASERMNMQTAMRLCDNVATTNMLRKIQRWKSKLPDFKMEWLEIHIIYTGTFKHVQTISLLIALPKEVLDEYIQVESAKINALSISPNTAKIAIAFGLKILFFEPLLKNNEETVNWKFCSSLPFEWSIYCLDWLYSGELVVGGDSLCLWQSVDEGKAVENAQPFVKIWEQRLARSIHFVKFSPDGNLFASIGKDDRLVKVWYKFEDTADSKADYQFNYLAHPRAVTNFTWRNSSKTNTPIENILFTTCMDGVCRVWGPRNSNELNTLYMIAIIDPAQSPVTFRPNEASFLDQDNVLSSPFHYIDGVTLADVVQYSAESRAALVAKGCSDMAVRVDKVKEALNDTPDMLFQVQSDGSLVVWGIHNLASRPRRIPKVRVISRLDNALQPVDVSFFTGNVWIYHDHLSSKSQSCFNPIEIRFLAQNPHGQLNSYIFNLVEFFESRTSASPLYRRFSWTGHRSKIRRFVRTCSDRIVASLAENGEVNLYEYGNPQFGQVSSNLLNEKTSIYPPLPIRLLTVLPGESYIAVYDDLGITIYSYDNSNCRSYMVARCDGNDWAVPVTFLHSFKRPTEGEEDISNIFLLAHCNFNNTALLWRIDIKKAGELSISFISSQSLDSSFSPSLVVALSDQTGIEPPINSVKYQKLRSVFLSYSRANGIVQYWRFAEDDTFQKSLEFNSGIEDATIIKCGAMNILAIVSSKSENKEFSIWSSIEQGTVPIKEFSHTSNESIIDMAWMFTSDAQHMLAIAFSNRVEVWGRKRKDDVVSSPNWIIYKNFGKDVSEMRNTSITWMDAGTIVLAAGHQIMCFSKWTCTPGSDFDSTSTKATIYDVMDEFNGILPQYHPTVLIQYMMWGKLQLVNFILMSLYNYLNIAAGHDKSTHHIPPVPFSKFLELEKSTGIPKPEEKYTGLFDNEDIGKQKNDDVHLTESAAQFLINYLSKVSLKDVSDLDRLHLMAQINTLAKIEEQKSSLDDCGARYLIFVRRFIYLNQNLPEEHRRDRMEYRDITWALHSDSQDVILETCLNYYNNEFGKILWKDARALGIFLWLSKNDSVKQQLEAVARNTYMSKVEKDPVDCSLLYLALRKKKLLHGLWRTASGHKEQQTMINFLANDFTEPRWQKAAQKNAFVLLGKQRHEYAAAFFLLADMLRDAVNVCLKHMNDFQLAIAICRAYEGDEGPVLKDILENHVIPKAIETGDRWLASIAFWMLNKRDLALKSTMAPLDSLIDRTTPSNSLNDTDHDPSLLILYEYLKNKTAQTRKLSLEITSEMEYNFIIKAAAAYERLGCSMLSLFVLRTSSISPPTVPDRAQTLLVAGQKAAQEADILNSGIVNVDDWGWNEPASTKPARAADLFADEPTPKLARAVDIFAEESSLKSRNFGSYTDIFSGELTSFNKGVDIFADEPKAIENEDTRLDAESQVFDNEASVQLTNDSLDLYKASLAMHIMKAALHSVKAVTNHTNILFHPTYEGYLDRVNEGIHMLCEAALLPRPAIDSLLIKRCEETDAYALSAHLLSQSITYVPDVRVFIQTLIAGCDILVYLSLHSDLDTKPAWDYLEAWARGILISFKSWFTLIQAQLQAVQANDIIDKIVLSAFLSLQMVAMRRKNYEQAWACVYNCRKLCYVLHGEISDLEKVIHRIATCEEKMIEVLDDEESSDDISDGNDNFFTETMSSKILEAASVNYIVLALETLVRDDNNIVSDELYPFITSAILEPLMMFSDKFEKELTKVESMELSEESIKRCFKDPKQKLFWQSLTTLDDIHNLLPYSHVINRNLNITAMEPAEIPENVYKTGSILLGFAINILNSKIITVCTKYEIHELDLSIVVPDQPMKRRGSSSSNSSIFEFSNSPNISDAESSDDELRQGGSDSEAFEASHKLHRKDLLGEKPGWSRYLQVREQESGATNMIKNVSFDNIQDVLKRGYKNVFGAYPVSQELPSPDKGPSSQNQTLLKRNIGVTCVESHPTFPIYLTGCDASSDHPSVCLWQFGEEKALMTYFGSLGKVTRVHFDIFGHKFGATDTAGDFHLWKFDSNLKGSHPFFSVNCHSKHARDFVFIDSSSFLATAGTSALQGKANHVCLWDTLLPKERSLISVLPVHETGAYALAYQSRNQQLISGGKRGEICISDVRQRTTVHTIQGHASRVRSLLIDESNNTLISGSIDGDLKVFDLNNFTEIAAWDVPARHRFLSPNIPQVKSYGVTQIQLLDEYIFATGRSGIMKYKKPVVVR